MSVNTLRLNPDKARILFKSSLVMGRVGTPLLAEFALAIPAFVRSLDVLEPELLREGQVVTLASGVYYQPWPERQICPFHDKKVLAKATHALLTSQLDYCSAFDVGLTWEEDPQIATGSECYNCNHVDWL